MLAGTVPAGPNEAHDEVSVARDIGPDCARGPIPVDEQVDFFFMHRLYAYVHQVYARHASRFRKTT
jgi:hypothetical protein